MPKKKTNAPTIVRPDNIDPQHRWDRPLQAPGHTQVDFEERVNFRRLHDYRLARTRAALAHSGLGALLCFDQHNIRYITSTVIGEWARDKLTRYALLTGNGDPYIWDFGSAAKHHRLHAPWLHHDHCRAGLLGLRGATGADMTLFRDAAREIKGLLDAEGVGTMPLGLDVVEPPMLFELQKQGIDVRDGQQTLLQARELKNIDELTLLNMASAMVDGVYHDIAAALKPKWYILGEQGAIVGEWRMETVKSRRWSGDLIEEQLAPSEAMPELCLFTYDAGGAIQKHPLTLPAAPSYAFHRNLANHLHFGEPLAVPPGQSRRNIAVMEAAKHSAEQGGETIVLKC